MSHDDALGVLSSGPDALGLQQLRSHAVFPRGRTEPSSDGVRRPCPSSQQGHRWGADDAPERSIAQAPVGLVTVDQQGVAARERPAPPRHSKATQALAQSKVMVAGEHHQLTGKGLQRSDHRLLVRLRSLPVEVEQVSQDEQLRYVEPSQPGEEALLRRILRSTQVLIADHRCRHHRIVTLPAMALPPLADRMRPKTLDEVVGQEHILAPDSPLRQALDAGQLRSMLLYGPPGCGKTTLARLVAEATTTRLEQLSAVLSGVKELREIIERARLRRVPTLLFVDEIHRWNKAQQDALLPHVEDGSITLIGATTENPGFSVRRTLISRAEVVRLHPLSAEHLLLVMQRALDRELPGITATSEALAALARLADGDARCALGLLERVTDGLEGELTTEQIALRLNQNGANLTLGEDEHFALASAFIKSLRGSDPDAALYWCARMLESGEDPRFIARRIVIFASEDVGNADPGALSLAVAAARAVEMLGLPEARIPLGQAVTYLACAPKSNASYKAMDAAIGEVRRTGRKPVPLHLRNASTSLDREEGVGKGYRYPHDHPWGIVEQDYLPEGVRGRFYRPVDWANERTIRQRLDWWAAKLEGDPKDP